MSDKTEREKELEDKLSVAINTNHYLIKEKKALDSRYREKENNRLHCYFWFMILVIIVLLFSFLMFYLAVM